MVVIFKITLIIIIVIFIFLKHIHLLDSQGMSAPPMLNFHSFTLKNLGPALVPSDDDDDDDDDYCDDDYLQCESLMIISKTSQPL